MFSAIARLHDRDYKDRMLIAGYKLLDEAKEKERIKKETSRIRKDGKTE